MYPGIDYDGWIEIIAKTLEASDFATAGKLVPLQADTIINQYENISALKGMVEIHPFNREDKYLEFMNRSGRILEINQEKTDSGKRRKATPIRRPLRPVLFRAVIEITDRVFDINVAREGIVPLLKQIAIDNIANDLDELIIMGNETGILGQDPDDLTYDATKYIKNEVLGSVDGVVTLIYNNGNNLDVSGYTTSSFNPGITAMMKKTLPKFRKGLFSKMQYYAAPDHVEDYRWYLGSRGSDSSLVGSWWLNEQDARYSGRPIKEIPMMDSNPTFVDVDQFATTNGTIVLTFKPIVAGSEISLMDAASTAYTTSFTDPTDFDLDDTTGVVTRATGSGITLNQEANFTYQGPGISFLTWASNIKLAMGRQEMELELWRQPLENKNYLIYRLRADVNIGDFDATVLCRGLTNRNYSTI